MRVLHVIDSLAPGGAEKSLAIMAPGLVSRGISLDIAYLVEREGVHSELESAGATLFNLSGAPTRVAAVSQIRKLVRSRRPDLVHTALFEANIAGRLGSTLARTPVVSTLAGLSYDRSHFSDPVPAWKMRMAQALDAVTARMVRRLHAVAAHVAEEMAERLRIPRSRIDVIPRGRDPKQLGLRTPGRTRLARDALGLRAGHRLLLAAARQEHKKGLDVLLEAAPSILARFPETRIVVAGREGSATAGLRSMLEERHLNERVLFLGHRSDLPELLCAADLLVFPSRSEGFPGTLLEAMALETPIIASDLPSVREVVGSPPVADLFPVGDSQRLATVAMASMGTPQKAKTTAEVARQRFLDQFTVDVITQRMAHFYQAAIRDGKGGRRSAE